MDNYERPQRSEEQREMVRGWTCNQFGIKDPDSDVPRLLRQVADFLDELGEIQVLGLTYCLHDNGAKVVAYFDLVEEE